MAGYIICALLLLAFCAGLLALLVLVLAFTWPQALMCLAFVLIGSYLLARKEPPARDLSMNESAWYDEEDERSS